MKLSKAKQLVLKKQQLLTNIQQQRNALSATSEHWLAITAPYDRTWQKILAFKPLVITSFSLIALYNIRHPKKLYRLSRRAIGVWGIAKTLQTFIAKKA